MNTNRAKKNFLLLFWGKLVSQLGDGIFAIAMPWFILSITDSAIAMSTYLVIGNLSCGLGLILFGKKIDVWKKEKVMYITDFIRGIYLLLLYAIASMEFGNKLAFIYCGAILLNICAAAFNPASMSIIPMIIKKDDLVKGNSILGVLDNTISILGLTVGVAVYDFLGIKLVFLIAGISYICSAISEMFIKPEYVNCSENDSREQQSGIIEGLKYLKRHKNTLFIIVFALTWNYIYISLYAIYIPYIFNVIFAENIGSIGLIEMALGIGLIIGASLASRLDIRGNIYKNLTKVVIVQLPLFAGFTIAIFINKAINYETFLLTAFTILLFILGITVAIVNVNISVILQSETSANFLGRVNAIKSFGSLITMALGLLIGGIIIDHIPYEYAFSINSILFALLTIFMVKKFYHYSIDKKIVTDEVCD